MNILLTAINAKYIHSNPAVYSLKASAGPYAGQVMISEFTINHTTEYILQEIYKKKPDVLCFSVYIWNLDYVERVAKAFHKLCPQVPIWVGGPEVSFEVAAFLKEHPYVTGVMIGEGEITFRETCAWYADGSIRPEEIRGIAFRRGALLPGTRGEELVFTAPREAADMDSLPFVYDREGDFTNRIIYYESSRGCPFSCSYCLSSVDKHLRFRSTGLVLPELQFFLDRQVPQIKFVDRTFNCRHDHAMTIWKYIKDHDNGITNFHFEIAADLVNEEELKLMSDMRPGLIQLEIGVQSTNPVTIREIHRSMDLEKVKNVVNRVHSFGNIHQHLDLIAGLPCEDYDSFRRSFDEIYALKCNQLQLGFLKVLKGSCMYDQAKEYGILYRDEPPYEVLSTPWLPYGDLLKIKLVEEMLEVYYNSGQFEVTMKVLEPAFGSPFDFYQQLGFFYEAKGYLAMSHSRIRRCQILLEFLAERQADRGILQMAEEALTFDLYYRENCKSRPSWAPDPGLFRQETHRWCKDGKLSHLEPFHYRFPGKEIRSLKQLPERLKTPVWVLFHYDRRDPLDHQAEYETLVRV